ncbi:MAG: hypothetical protein H7Y11_03825 [Armatimonadetes bacterium]|nr:hypothetical protein [Anaerolineae bacterium]
MSIKITRLEPGVYRAELSGVIPLTELMAAQQEGATLAQQHGDAKYALILDIQRGVQMPFELRSAGEVVQASQASALLTVGAGWHIRLLAGLLGGLFGVGGVQHCDNLPQAVARARVAVQSK